MTIVVCLLLFLGLVCFGVAAFGRRLDRVDLVALGLGFWILVELIQSLQKL